MLRLYRLKKRTGKFFLGPLDLFVAEGEYFVLLGPSGAGKTLLLEILAGFKQPDGGEILLDGRRIDNLPIQKRGIGYLCQGNTLFPHLTVRENISYGLRFRPFSKIQTDERVEQMARETGILHLLERKTEGLSGGERQRVALARMLVLEPACLLLDEPLTGLDAILKQDILGLLLELHSKGRTFIHVTHDPLEARAVASRIAIIEEGSITQEGPPHEFLIRPETEFAARFAGIRNFFHVEAAAAGNEISGERVSMRLIGRKDMPRLSVPASMIDGEGSMFMVIDQDMVKVHEWSRGISPKHNCLEGTVKAISPSYGAEAALIVDVGFEICASVTERNTFRKGSRVLICWPDEALTLYKGKNCN